MTRRSHERGHAMLIVTVLFTAAMLAIALGVLPATLRQIQIAHDFQNSKQSYYAAEAGGEDAFYRIRNNLGGSYPMNVLIGSTTALVNVTQIGLNEQLIAAEGSVDNLIRNVLKTITTTDGFDFLYAMQTGIGGISLSNNAYIIGNVYASGPITSTNTNSNSYNLIKGSVVSAGPNGIINQIHATSSAYAHVIKNATIDKDAYYQHFGGATSSVSIGGVSYPNSADQPLLNMPISDALVAEWESNAASGGTATCVDGAYTITSSVTIGPRKIPCNLTISGNGTVVTLTGTIWVTGNITITGSGGAGVQIKVADSVGNKTVPMIADNAANSAGSSMISIDGNSNFYGSTGNTSSFVLLVSMNTSAESGGANTAINVINGAAGNVLTYAPHGEIKMQNNVYLREVTSYKVTLINNAVVNYNTGLSQGLFTSGASGSWKIKQWKEGTQRP